jgi:hypothetical protein
VPPLRDRAGEVGWWLTVGVVVGGLAGGVIGGIGGRLVMLVLRLASDANGVVSDDGFTIGEFSLLDTLGLYAGMTLAGALNGAAYVAVRRLLPARARVTLWGLLGAAAVGGLVVHTDGADFTLLEPRWLAVASFVLLPGIAALLLAWLIERSARIEPWRCSRWLGLLALPTAPAVLAAPLLLLGAGAVLGLGRFESFRRLPSRRLPQLLALGLVVAGTVAGGVDLARDTVEIL